MNEASNLLENRIQRSLQALGFRDIKVEHLGRGRVRIGGHVESGQDRAIVVATVNTVPGVSFVTCTFGKS